MENKENKIYSAIPRIMSEISAISKNQRNQQQGFAYRGVDDVMNELHSIIARNGVFIVPNVTKEERSERTKSTGTVLFYTRLTVEFRFCADDGSSVSATVIGEAMDSGDKASNKALSIAFKYACLQVFCIPTQEEKDPDAQSHEISAPANGQETRQQKQNSVPDTKPAPQKKYTKEQAAELKRILESSTYPDGSLVFLEADKDAYRAMVQRDGQGALESIRTLLVYRLSKWEDHANEPGMVL